MKKWLFTFGFLSIVLVYFSYLEREEASLPKKRGLLKRQAKSFYPKKDSEKTFKAPIKKESGRKRLPAQILKKSHQSNHFYSLRDKGLVMAAKRPFLSAGQHYKEVENVFVVNASKRDDYDSSLILKEGFKKIFVKGRRPNHVSEMVVQNARTKQLGILTGVLKVKLNDFEQALPLMNEYGLVKVAEFPGISLLLLKVKEGGNLDHSFISLRDDERVKRVELEVLENLAVTK